MGEQIDPQEMTLGRYAEPVTDATRELDGKDFVRRFWAKDASLWGSSPERQKSVESMLGWVDVLPKIEARLPEIEAFVQDVRSAGFERVVLAGMGGSSLAPLVFSECIPKGAGGLPLEVLDSTDPATVLRIAGMGDLSKTLVVVASKSGTTAEPTAFEAYFYDRVGRPENFVAITDPGSPFAKHAQDRKFRKVFLNYADIGGRFSALSLFGLVPAALMGLDVRGMIRAAQRVEAANQGSVLSSPAFHLGAALGALAKRGRDKLTFVTPPELEPLGLWMEQLVAESTGKEGTGILPIAGEPLGGVGDYGVDRVFVQFRTESGSTDALDELARAGHPVVRIDLVSPYGIAEEMFRFELATATAGALLDINPFDQPNVQESKDVTKRLLDKVEREGKLPDQTPSVTEGPLRVFGDTCAETVTEAIRIFLSGRQPDDYIAIMAYLPESPSLSADLKVMQRTLRDTTRLATTMGYGPRFLHSTGQYHKGGPSNGYYLQLTGGHLKDDAIPGHKATWGQFVDAQAMGDMEALTSKGRRVLRIDVGPDPEAGLASLRKTLSGALDDI